MDFFRRCWAEIDIDALLHNFESIKTSANGAKLMAVVKANCYGHSSDIIAPILDKNGAFAFAVSNIEEGIQLREMGIEKPILILGFTPPEYVESLYKYDISQAVFSPEFAASLSEYAVKKGVTVKIHLKLDTGMCRIGFDCRDDSLSGIEDAVAAAKLPGFDFKGVFTHFCLADRTEEEEDGFTDSQYKRFYSAVSRIKQSGLNPQVCHCCNSAALSLDKEKHMDMCRPGIILYGLTPAEGLKLDIDLEPVMTFKSVVSMVKTIKKGDTVSYGRTFTAQNDMKIATVSAGYADGYPRLLSNKGQVVINGKRANIIGRVCMDQFTVDVSDISDVKQGDEVILFGKELPVEEIADICGTINYEITCDISPRVPRIAVNPSTNG